MKVKPNDFGSIIRGNKVSRLAFPRLKQIADYQSKKASGWREMSGTFLRSKELNKKELETHTYLKSVREVSAAVSIQRFARGFINRHEHDRSFLLNRKQELHYSIHRLSMQTEHCLLDLGLTDASVRLLQRNIRIFLFRRKLYYLGLCYEVLIESRLEKAREVLRPFIRIYCCKVKIIIKQFQTMKKKVLKKVKRRLAVITIKKAWVKNNLTFQVMRDRLVKRKRRWLARKSKALYKKVMTTKFASAAIQKQYRKKQPLHQFKENKDSYVTLGTNEPSQKSIGDSQSSQSKLSQQSPAQSPAKVSSQALTSQVKFNQYAEGTEVDAVKEEEAKSPRKQPSDDSELDEMANEYDDELLREMNLRRIAHNVRDFKPIEYEPTIDPDYEYKKLELNTFAIAQKYRGKNVTNKTNRNLQITSPSILARKYGHSSRLPPLMLLEPKATHKLSKTVFPTTKVQNERFLKNTSAFKSKIKRKPKDSPEKSPLSSTFAPAFMAPPKKRLLKNTISHELKLKNKLESMQNNIWVPVVRRKDTYLPGLNSTTYSPDKWSPLPISKEILDSIHSRHLSLPMKDYKRSEVSMSTSPGTISFINFT